MSEIIRVECPWCGRAVALDQVWHRAVHDNPACEDFRSATRELSAKEVVHRLGVTQRMNLAASKAMAALNELPFELRVGATGALLAELERETPGFAKRIGEVLVDGLDLAGKRKQRKRSS